MKTKLFALAGALAFVMLLGHYYAKPVLAQIRAALVQNVDEPGRNPYQESSPCTFGISNQSCTLQFSAVPAGKRLVLTNIGGSINVMNGVFPIGTIASSLVGSQNAFVPFTAVRGAPNGVCGGCLTVYFDQQVRAYFGPGEVPNGMLEVHNQGAFTNGGPLVLSGYFVNLP
jgi:hypothetical protein